MVMQAAFKGKVYSQIYRAFEKYGYYELLEMVFVLKSSSLANKLLKSIEDEEGNVDYAAVDREWGTQFGHLLSEEIEFQRLKKEQTT